MANSFKKISNILKKMLPFENKNNSTQRGKVYPNHISRLYEQMQVEMDRRKIYEECWAMYSEDARISAAIDTTAGSATNGSFTINFNSAKTENKKLLDDSSEILYNLKRKSKLDSKIQGIAKELLILGDVFLEVIIDPDLNEIVNLKKLPARTIDRIEDEYGNLLGFEQKNELNEIIAKFEPWQILHMRWNHFSGQKYGTSMLKGIRAVYKKLKMTEEDLVIRRRTRAGLKLHHYGSNPEEPLEDWEVDEYMEQNQSNPMNVRTDWYSNGKWKIDVLRSDDGVSEIKDIKHFEDSLFIGLRTPKGILGIGEDPNRATLERQEVAYIRLLNEVTNIISEQLRQVFDLSLIIKGINPDNVEYTLVWEEKTVEDINKTADRLILLANTGMISRQTAVGEMGYDFEDEQEKIEIERKMFSHLDYNETKYIDPNSIAKSMREKLKHQGRGDDGKENVKTQIGEE